MWAYDLSCCGYSRFAYTLSTFDVRTFLAYRFGMNGEAPSQAEHVIGKLGGVNSAARVLGHRNASTVQGWKTRGFVPASRQEEVLTKANAAGIALSPLDFVVHLRSAMASTSPPEELLG